MSNPVADELIAKTLKELLDAEKPRPSSRSWTAPQGYKFLIQWSNSVLLRILVRKLTETLPKSEYRMKAQVDDAARSVVANIEEGYKRSTTSEYRQFIGYSQGSLEEVKGDIERLMQDKYLPGKPGSKLSDLGIDLKTWNDWCRNPLNSSKILYIPLNPLKGTYPTSLKLREASGNLEELKGSDLTYEIFIELINKTDYLLRKLVFSLDNKIRQDKLKLLK